MTMTDDENHYTELRERYQGLIGTHREVDTLLKSEDEEGLRDNAGFSFDVGESAVSWYSGYRRGMIHAIAEIEELLNDWNGRDDRDGSQ